MPGFHFYRSPSTQALADRFVQVVTDPATALPLDADELVVVQGRGMERWLSQRAAARLGVWAGAKFPYPRAAAADLATRVLGGESAPRAGDDSMTLAFAVAAELPAVMQSDAGARVHRYVGEDGARLLSFAQQAAGVLDGYLVHRPEMLQEWANGREGDSPDEAWQAALWRGLLRRADERRATAPQLAAMVDFWPRVMRATKALAAGAPCPGVSRLSVFAVASVPPQLVQFFAELGRTCDVHWFAVDPAAETAGSPAPLTVAMCATDLESVAAVEDAAQRAAEHGVAVTTEVLPGRGVAADASLLARLQWLARTGKELPAANRDGGSGGDDAGAQRDRSIRVHACPGSMREMEVLHDELLRAHEELPGLTHEDVVVLVPDIAKYAPVVEAVMRGGRGIGKTGVEARIPTSIADLSDRDGSPVAVALATALEIADGDMGVRSALDLLGQPVVAERFVPQGRTAEDVAEWLTSSGARRFLDADHREGAGLPRSADATWDASLDRLFVGLASPEGEPSAVPGTEVFPAQPFLLGAASLGKVGECMQFLRGLRRMALSGQAAGGRPVAEWLSDVRAVLVALAPARGPGEREARALGQQLAAIEQSAVAAGFEELMPFIAVRTLLLQSLAAGRAGRGFLAGGVTVCQFVPMRAVPFRVVCMLGMNDDQFPRSTVRLAFDAIGKERKPGDRDARAEDRALFLQSVLGASDRLVVAYSATDLSSGKDRTMSTAVESLLDAASALACDAGAGHAERERARRALVVGHPLHAFSIKAFAEEAARDDRVGYDARARIAAERLLTTAGLGETPAFLRAGAGGAGGGAAGARGGPGAGACAGAGAGAATVSLEDLISFFADPARSTLRAWGISLHLAEDAAPEHEHIEINSLDRFNIHDTLRLAHLAGREADSRTILSRMQHDGRLPLGAMGRWQGEGIAASVAEAIRVAFPDGVQWTDIGVELDVPHAQGTQCVRLTGRAPTSRGAAAHCVSSKLAARRKLEGWMIQLAVAANGDGAGEGLALGSELNRPFPLPPVTREEARAMLAQLLAMRAFGLEHGLPYFPDPSWKAAMGANEGKPIERILDDVDSMWEDEDSAFDTFSESSRVLFRGMDPLRADMGAIPGVCQAMFLSVATAVLGPIARKAARKGAAP